MNNKQIKTISVTLILLLFLAVLYFQFKPDLMESNDKTQLSGSVPSDDQVLPVSSPSDNASIQDIRSKYDPGLSDSSEQITEKLINLVEFEEADLSLVDDSDVQAVLKDIPINRYRIVKINADELRSVIENDHQNDEINFRFFEDSIYQAKKSRSKSYYEGPRAGMTTWAGTVENDPSTVMTVIVSAGGVKIKTFGRSGIYHTFKLPQGDYYAIADLIYVGGPID